MGLRHSHHQRYSPGPTGYERANGWPGVKESQYGSWTKLSLVDQALYQDDPSSSTATTSPPTSPDLLVNSSVNSSDDDESDLSNVSPPSCTRLLTQPQQDFILREVAEKLIDVDPDVTPPPSPSQQQQHHRNTNEVTPLSQAISRCKHSTPSHHSIGSSGSYRSYSFSQFSPLCSKEELKRKQIAKSFLDHFEELVKQVDPEDLAHKLYGIAVIDTDEVECASFREEPIEDRARSLLQLLKRKLWANPEWFVDVCKILRNCDVNAVSEMIDEVQRICPTDEMSDLSSRSQSFSSGGKRSRQSSSRSHQSSYFDTFGRLEKSYKEKGLQGATEFVNELCTNKPDVLLLHEACLNGVDVSNLDLLLTILSERENHNIDAKNECGQTPLHVACASLRSPAESEALDNNNTEQRLKIEHLLTHKASNSIKDKDGNTPLHLAILREDSESVSMLLKSGKRCLNGVNKRGNAGLHLACRLGLVGIVKTLCSYNANTSIQNKKMRTALHLACINGHVDTAMELASHDPSTMDAFDRHRMTPLHIACKKTDSTLTISLLKLKNCLPNKADKENKTPLHYACAWGNLSVVVRLLEKDSSKAFVDVQDSYGDTALHIASRQGHKDVVKELLNRKASKDILNLEVKNPLEVAIECDHQSIAAKMMRKRGWNQRRKRLKGVRKHRRTASPDHLEGLEMLDYSSSESEGDETINLGALYRHHH